jgi:hypothetical protein
MPTIEQPTAKNISAMKGQITKAQNLGAELVIETDADEQKAVELLTIIKSNNKAITAEKRKFLDPINALTKQTRDFFRPVETQMDEAERLIKSKLSAYQMVKQRKLQEEEAKLQERMKSEEMKPSEVVQAMQDIQPERTEPIRAKKGSASYRIVYRATIQNPAQVPQMYYELNESRAKKDAIEAHKQGLAPIPGVTVVEEKDVSVRV